ncbi:MAG: hypothetical protein ACE5NN_01205 [Candidatus Bathyarchaeia archaeon]
MQAREYCNIHRLWKTP